MTTTQNSEISNTQVADFLRNHPDFFEHHAHLLAEITLPSPHGNGVISLAERQQLAQRDKVRVLEAMMAEMIKHAEENDVTSDKVHQLSLQLLNQQSFSALQQHIAEVMRLDFSVSQCAIRIWVRPSNNTIAKDPAFTPVSETFSNWIMTLKQAHGGKKPEAADDLLPENLKSYAYIPLCKKSLDQRPFGVLVLGSEEASRFTAEMGTLYLDRIGELVSVALLNHLFALQL
ncbi:MAG: DUF484 family protein [Betaproteobacteria bacterium]|nr:DUF484 family protein [Betaproteobacteria bacterium]